MKEKIQAALAKLDPKNNNHWTEDGLPRVETVRMLAADPKLTRDDITADFPNFNRQNTALATDGTAQQGAAAATPAATAVPAPAAPAQRDPVLEQPTGDPDEERPAPTLEQRLEEAQAELEAIRLEKARIDQAFADMSHLVDKLHTEIDEKKRLPGDQSVTHTIRAYLESQHRQRIARGQVFNEFRQSGIKLKDILPTRSKLDEALARQNKKK